ncbi:MAG: hypothetical protein JSW26_13540, partial [Desulfobacterales bacterium]
MIDKRNSKKANIEYRIMNIPPEADRRETFCLFYKKRLSTAKPPFDILRFDIRYSVRRGGLFRLGEV